MEVLEFWELFLRFKEFSLWKAQGKSDGRFPGQGAGNMAAVFALGPYFWDGGPGPRVGGSNILWEIFVLRPK